jgi:hypothetical protein
MLRIFVVLPTILCVAVTASAQTVTGILEGRVYDPTGALVAGAKVQVKEKSTGTFRSAESNAEGYYQFAFVPLGEYDIAVDAPGFQGQTRTAIVSLNRATVVDFHVKVSGVQEAITVTEAAPVIITTSGQINRSLEDRTIASIPIPGRNFLTLATLLPGFQTNPTSGQNNPTLSSGSSVSFNGTGTRGATFQTDGVANDDNSENQNRQAVNVSTIKEFQIVTNSFAAEFGRGSGAVVLVQTKGGANATHGEAYWLTSNSALNARTYFANEAGWRINPTTGKEEPIVPKTSSKTHRPGGTLGGAIVKDKLFYFGSYERFYAPGAVTSTVSLLPKEFRTPQVDPQLPDAAARRAWIQSVIDRYPNVEPNNTVNNPNGYTASVERDYHTNDWSGRVDYNLNEKNFVYARYQFSDFFIQTGEIVRGINAKQDHRSQNVGITWTRVFSPTVSGEFRFGFGRRRMIVGLNDGDKVPIVAFNITFAPSQLGNANAYPLKRHQNDFQYVYNVSAQLGSKHTLKFGTDTRRTQLNDEIQNYHRGQWNFSATGEYNALENFVRGIVQQHIRGYGPNINGYRSTEVNLYVQDDYRATPSVTLNLGARFERVGKPSEVNNLVDLGYGSDSYIEPRFGFAWSPAWKDGLLGKLAGGPGRSVVRGGFGLSHGRIFQSMFSQIGASVRFNPPNGAQISRSDPNMSVASPFGDYVFTPGFPNAQVALSTIDPGLRMPYTEQWNLTIERQLPKNSALSISYIGNRGIGFLQYQVLNRAQFPVVSSVPVSFPGQNFPGVLFDKIDPNLFNTNPAAGFISLSQPRTAARRQDGRFSSILNASNDAWSYYNSLQTTFTKRLSHNLAFTAGYSWSKNIDTGSEATFVGAGDTNTAISERDSARAMRGLSRLDQPHRFVFSYTYDFPFFQNQAGVLGRVLGGWQASSISTFAAGNPITVVLGYDLNGDGVGADRPWLLNPGVHGESFDNARIDPATGRQYAMDIVPTSAFFPDAAVAATRQWPWFPGTGYVGSAGRNIFRIHGQNNWDVAFVKNTRLLGKDRPHTLQFRAEMFNFLNRVQFGVPNNTLLDTGVVGWRINPLFGRITGLNNSPRNMQMTLRYQF